MGRPGCATGTAGAGCTRRNQGRSMYPMSSSTPVAGSAGEPSSTPGPGPGDLGPGLADNLRAAYATGLTRPVGWRREQLGQLVRMMRQEAGALTDAMADDLGKPELEGWLTDVAAVRRDIQGIMPGLDDWSTPRPVRVPWTMKPGRARIVPEPLGAVLVIGPGTTPSDAPSCPWPSPWPPATRPP